jgi:hypothetical protein
MNLNLSFAFNEEDDILNVVIQDSDTGSAMYTVDTPKYTRGTLTTTVTRHNRADGSSRSAFRILWKGGKGSLEDVKVVLDFGSLKEIPIREIFGRAPGSTT